MKALNDLANLFCKKMFTLHGVNFRSNDLLTSSTLSCISIFTVSFGNVNPCNLDHCQQVPAIWRPQLPATKFPGKTLNWDVPSSRGSK
jgi:hypothetical protein